MATCLLGKAAVGLPPEAPVCPDPEDVTSLVWATVQAVSKRKLQPTRAAFTLTPSAGNKIKHFLDKSEHVGVKVGVEPGVVMAFLML